ncbi:hypothetical protein GBO34_01745 [Roseivirga pacifica]|nr:hypothetical protein [Roseivirga pacifica]MCO6368039.1 hypothetical protein [Roseivirga pacifica]MCO6369479.1 hypothetical protein [Roseivirga pacifica]MCO6373333.1 hypothetical protein [Roseivirga pacifica]MCO6377410.1 hypothetical protein [Roseivirga pacifica]
MNMNKMRPMFSYSALSEYMIIALPYAEIGDEVKEFKKDFFRRYGAYSGQNSCAHIRLMSFFQSEEREERLLEATQDVLTHINSFEVFLNGFSFDGTSRNVYLEVLNKQSLIGVYDSLRLRLFKELVSLAFLNKKYEPMLTIGQRLTPLQFLEAIRDYEHVPYTNNFRISRLHVLKRKAPFTTWEHLTALPFAKSQKEMLGLYE